MKTHRVTNYYPDFTPEAYANLLASIRTNGLLVPVTVMGDVLLDGRHRMAACEQAGVPLRTVEYDGDDPVGFIIAMNERRDMTPSQRMMVAAKIAKLGRGRPPEIAQPCAIIDQPESAPAAPPVTTTQTQAAQKHRVSRRGVQKARVILDTNPELAEKVMQGKVTVNQAEASIQREKRTARFKDDLKTAVKDTAPVVECADAREWLARQEPADLLLTDPPYMTDVPDIAEFARSWLPLALSKVKSTGRAYICVGAYPQELHAYQSVAMPTQILPWTYRNTLGPSPAQQYKQNWQAVLYYVMPDAPPLNCPSMIEHFSVQDINAPDGRLGDRFHAWQKPLELAERFIRHGSKPGDTVIDPFCGTGTFILAAAKLGRVSRGSDIDSGCLDIAVDRGCLKSFFTGSPTLSGRSTVAQVGAHAPGCRARSIKPATDVRCVNDLTSR